MSIQTASTSPNFDLFKTFCIPQLISKSDRMGLSSSEVPVQLSKGKHVFFFF